jgi:hypothetical protein
MSDAGGGPAHHVHVFAAARASNGYFLRYVPRRRTKWW